MSLKKAKKSFQEATTSALRFVKKLDVQHGKPLPLLTKKQTILPVAIASLLFFMWGFAYGLLDTMNFHVRSELGLKRETAAYLAASYYAAYIPGPLLLSGPMVRKCGYRVAFIFGLSVFGLGNFVISAAAQRGASGFPGMVAGMFVIGIGVSSLERSANPYVVNCGPRIQATLRILVAQAMAGVGTVIAPLVARRFLFEKPTATTCPERATVVEAVSAATSPAIPDLSTVISLYRGVGGIVLALSALAAVLFFRTWVVPEAPQHDSPKSPSGWKFWKHPLFSMGYARLWWAVVANFVNLGCQVAFAQFFMEHMDKNACVDSKQGSAYLSVAQTAFVFGRFAAAGLVTKPKIFKPRIVLFVFIAGAIAFTAAGTVAKMNTAVAFASMVMFWEGPSFPMIFESADADLGEWSSLGETIMIVSISGGALQTPLLGKLVNTTGIAKGWILTAAAFGFVWTYCWACNLIPSFRKALDKAQCEEESNNVDERSGSEKLSESDQPKDGPKAHVEDSGLARSNSSSSRRGYFGGAGGHMTMH